MPTSVPLATWGSRGGCNQSPCSWGRYENHLKLKPSQGLTWGCLLATAWELHLTMCFPPGLPPHRPYLEVSGIFLVWFLIVFSLNPIRFRLSLIAPQYGLCFSVGIFFFFFLILSSLREKSLEMWVLKRLNKQKAGKKDHTSVMSLNPSHLKQSFWADFGHGLAILQTLPSAAAGSWQTAWTQWDRNHLFSSSTARIRYNILLLLNSVLAFATSRILCIHTSPSLLQGSPFYIKAEHDYKRWMLPQQKFILFGWTVWPF